jgi:hypothetical protein
MADIEASKSADDKNEVFVTPQHLDQEAARLNLARLGVRLAMPTRTQAGYRGVAGPYEAQQYRHWSTRRAQRQEQQQLPV